MLWHVLARLEASPLVTDIVLVVRREDMDYCRRHLSEGGDFGKSLPSSLGVLNAVPPCIKAYRRPAPIWS